MATQKAKTHKGAGHRQRLKQRFIENGLDGFHDYEVVELLLSLNTPRKDCKDSAKDLLKKFKSFPAVLEAPEQELEEIDGIGKANSLGLKLIKEVCDRYLRSRIISKDVVKNSKDLIDYLNHSFSYKNKEYFVGIFLDAKNRVLASEILSHGTLTSSSVYPREVIIKALRYNSAAVIFAHNHPSGDYAPSQNDIKITRKLLFALKLIGIILHEHLVIGRDGFFSFAENGYIFDFNKEFDADYG